MSAQCVDDGDYVQAANDQASAIQRQYIIDIAIQGILALWNRNSSSSIAALQQSLTEQNIALAEEALAHAKAFWPYEQDFLADVFSMSKYDPAYAATSASWGAIVDADMANSRKDYLAKMAAMCRGVSRCADARWLRKAGLYSADVRNYALRQEENRAQAMNDLRYAWQYAALGLGQGKLADVVSFQKVAGITGASAGNLLGGFINAAVATYGALSAPPLTPLLVREGSKYLPPSKGTYVPPSYTYGANVEGLG